MGSGTTVLSTVHSLKVVLSTDHSSIVNTVYICFVPQWDVAQGLRKIVSRNLNLCKKNCTRKQAISRPNDLLNSPHPRSNFAPATPGKG